MGIWHRVQRVFEANAHSAVDQLETPQAMLNQVQRELVEAIVKLKGAIKQGQRWCVQMEEDVARLTAEIGNLERTAGEALQDGNEALARRAVERKLRKQQHLARKQPQLEKARAQLARQEQRLDRLKLELSELKAQCRDLIQRQRYAEVFATAGPIEDQAEPISVVVERMQEKVLYAEAACEVNLGCDEDDPLDAELARQDIERELDAMRSQTRASE